MTCTSSCILQILTQSELELVADLCKRYDVMCLSDEVYEWLVYSGSEHIKIGKHNVNRRLNIFAVRSKEHIFTFLLSLPSWYVGENYHSWECRKDVSCHWMESKIFFGFAIIRSKDHNSLLTTIPPLPPSLPLSLSLSPSPSLSLSLSPSSHEQTGWAIAPSYLIKPMHMCLTNISYTYNTPIQEAIAVGLETEMQRMGQPDSYLVQTVETLQRKRDELAAVLKEVGMDPIVPEGGYFILADTSSIGKTFDSNEEAYDFLFTKWMIAEKVIKMKLLIMRCIIVLQYCWKAKVLILL